MVKSLSFFSLNLELKCVSFWGWDGELSLLMKEASHDSDTW